MTDANGITTEFTYHVRGWLTTSTIKHPSGNTSLDATTTYNYDAVGQIFTNADLSETFDLAQRQQPDS